MKNEIRAIASMDNNKSDGKVAAEGSYAQFYMYRVPKKNHEAMLALEKQIDAGWRRHGIVGSEFFQLTPHETVRGFTNFAERLAAEEDEEVWVEVQHYKDREHRDEIFASIRKDVPMLELFGKWYGLVTPGSVMGDFNKLLL